MGRVERAPGIVGRVERGVEVRGRLLGLLGRLGAILCRLALQPVRARLRLLQGILGGRPRLLRELCAALRILGLGLLLGECLVGRVGLVARLPRSPLGLPRLFLGGVDVGGRAFVCGPGGPLGGLGPLLGSLGTLLRLLRLQLRLLRALRLRLELRDLHGEPGLLSRLVVGVLLRALDPGADLLLRALVGLLELEDHPVDQRQDAVRQGGGGVVGSRSVLSAPGLRGPPRVLPDLHQALKELGAFHAGRFDLRVDVVREFGREPLEVDLPVCGQRRLLCTSSISARCMQSSIAGRLIKIDDSRVKHQIRACSSLHFRNVSRHVAKLIRSIMKTPRIYGGI